MTSTKCCDISSLQGSVNFQQMKSSGIEGIVIRCGIGNSGIDSKCSINVRQAKSAGILTSLYHFCYPLPEDGSHNNRDPKQQAQYHFSNSPPVDGIVWADIEYPNESDFSKWGVDGSFIVNWLLNYTDEYKRLSGKAIGIYSYVPYLTSIGIANSQEFSDMKFWVASYTNDCPPCPTPFKSIAMWQWAGNNGRIAGVSAACDEDICYDESVFMSS